MTTNEQLVLKELQNYFTLNLDESCVVASEGVLSVIGSAHKSKHEKNLQDNQEIITIVQVGSAANVDGPRIYLAKGNFSNLQSVNNFCSNYEAPSGSCVEMTPNAYMTNEVWVSICSKLHQGVGDVEVICDHPDKWAILSLDGFGSHLCPQSVCVFHHHKILVMKEDGDTSQVSQAYDQLVAIWTHRVTFYVYWRTLTGNTTTSI